MAMKLVIAVVHDEDAGVLIKKLNQSEFRVTRLASTGGFLKAGNTTLLIGVLSEKLQECVGIIEKTCSTRREVTAPPVIGEGAFIGMPLEISVGGATVFVVDVEQYLRL